MFGFEFAFVWMGALGAAALVARYGSLRGAALTFACEAVLWLGAFLTVFSRGVLITPIVPGVALLAGCSVTMAITSPQASGIPATLSVSSHSSSPS
jgi:hypothetical protein